MPKVGRSLIMMAGRSAIVYTRKKKSASMYARKKIFMTPYFLDMMMAHDRAIKMGGKIPIFCVRMAVVEQTFFRTMCGVWKQLLTTHRAGAVTAS